MKLIRLWIVTSSLLLASQANAATSVTPASILGPIQSTAQSNFEALSDDLAAAAWMNPSNSAEPHSAGFIPVGVQIAVEGAFLDIDKNASHWALMNYSAGTLPVPRVRASVGIPFGLDAGIMYMSSSQLKIDMTGAEIRMAFGNYIPIPMLEANVRYHTSKLTAGSELEVKNSGFSAMVGANLPFIKPYIEVGTVKSTSTPMGALVSGPIVLSRYETRNTTSALGAKLEFMFMVLNVELAKVGDKQLTNVKFGFEF